MTQFICKFFSLFFYLKVGAEFNFYLCLLHMCQDLQCCIRSSGPALVTSSPNHPPAVGPQGSPAWSYTLAWAQFSDQACGIRGRTMMWGPLISAVHQVCTSSQWGLQRDKTEEPWRYESSGWGRGQLWDGTRGANTCQASLQKDTVI